MARGEYHFKMKASHFNDLSLCNVYGFECSRHRRSEASCEEIVVGQGELVFRMHVYRKVSVYGCQFRNAQDMVEMSVGEHYAYRFKAAGGYETRQRVALGSIGKSRIDNGAAACLVPYHAAACLEAVESEFLYVYHDIKS